MDKEQHIILWNNFRNGDNDALNELFMYFSHDLYSYGLRISPDEDLVKDCIQEVFIHLIDKKKSLHISSSFQIYLFKSLRNKIFEELRKIQRTKLLSSQLFIKEQQSEKFQEQLIIDSEEQTIIRKKLISIINELPARQQEILYLRYTNGFNYEEISQLLSIDVASARKLLYRTIKKIREKSGTQLLVLFISLRSLYPSHKKNIGVRL